MPISTSSITKTKRVSPPASKKGLIFKENKLALRSFLSKCGKAPGSPEITRYLEIRGMNLLTQKKNALLSADCLIEAIFLSAELPRSQEALQMNDSLAKIMQKKNALLSADCLVEAASLSTGQRRSRAALQVKDALAKSVAALEEENPKIGDAYNLLNKIDGSSRPSGSKDQDAWAGLVYVIENMLQVSKNLKESGISFLAGGLLSVCSELGQASGLLNYRSVTKEKIGIVMERLPIIKASADQLRGLMQSALSGIQEYLALT